MVFVMRLYIYNLYPRLLGNINNWYVHIPRIKNMGFDWIYINPINECGFSGSLYAVKSYYDYNPNFFDNPDMLYAENDLKEFISECSKNGVNVMMDIVINHSAKDSPLVIEYANWYKYNEDGSVKSPGAWDRGEWVSWGDLAEFDNEKKEDGSHENIWNYWRELFRHSIELGFSGFRCDAAYKVPSELWKYIISYVKNIKEDAVFFAESLGCSMNETLSLVDNGFDYVASSAKWWDFTSSWFLKQYEELRLHSKQITFPENHDTERLITECKGNIDKLKMHAFFTAIVTNGWMITLGFEYGARKRCDVVNDMPSDFEDIHYDISDYTKRLIEYISQNEILCLTGKLEPIALLSETEAFEEDEAEIYDEETSEESYENAADSEAENSEDHDRIFDDNYSFVRAFYKYNLDESKKILIFANIGQEEDIIDVSAFNVKKDISFDEKCSFDSDADGKRLISIKPYRIKIFEVYDE